jgi:hypothetical protein
MPIWFQLTNVWAATFLPTTYGSFSNSNFVVRLRGGLRMVASHRDDRPLGNVNRPAHHA